MSKKTKHKIFLAIPIIMFVIEFIGLIFSIFANVIGLAWICLTGCIVWANLIGYNFQIRR